MKKNLLSLLVLALMLGIAVSACAKKEEPTEAASNLVDDAGMPTQADAMKTDLDEDIFDLDTAQDALDGAMDQAQDTATEFTDQTTDAVQGAMDNANDDVSSLLGSLGDSATSDLTAKATDVVEAAIPAVPTSATAEEEAKKKLEAAAATTAVTDLNKISQ